MAVPGSARTSLEPSHDEAKNRRKKQTRNLRVSKFNIKEIESILLEDIGTIYHNFEDKTIYHLLRKVAQSVLFVFY